MSKKFVIALLAGTAVCAICGSSAARAEEFNIPAGDLDSALNAYSAQSGVQLIMSDEAVKGVRSKGVTGNVPASEALTR